MELGSLKVEIVEGDITLLESDAIVNAANRFLKHGGGVAAAIVRRGGIEIQEESDEYIRKHGPLRTGEVAVTGAGKLKAKFVIHAVGPVYGEEGEEKLAEAIRNSLEAADRLKLKSLAMPAISTGVYGYPMEICARVMRKQLEEFSKKRKFVEKVTICLYGKEAYQRFKQAFEEG